MRGEGGEDRRSEPGEGQLACRSGLLSQQRSRLGAAGAASLPSTAELLANPRHRRRVPETDILTSPILIGGPIEWEWTRGVLLIRSPCRRGSGSVAALFRKLLARMRGER